MKKYTQHGLIFIAYILLTVGMTWPATAHLSSRLVAEGGDAWQTLWRFNDTWHHAQTAFRTGQGIDFLQSEFLGTGSDRLINLSTWPWMPSYLLFGEVITYNIVWLLSFIVSGYAIYLLLLTLSPDSNRSTYIAAFIAGVYYMFLPYHVAHAAGHFGAMQIQWLPLILLSFVRWWKKPNWLISILLAGLIGIQAWTEHHYMLWLSLFALIAAIYWREEIQTRFSDKKWRHAAVFTAVCICVFVIIPYLPTIRLASQAGNSLDLGEEQTIRFSADLFSFIIPAPFHSIWGTPFKILFTDSFTGNPAEATQYVGFASLLFLIFFYRSIPTKVRTFWLIITISFLFIALGPKLHLFGRVLPIPLPYAAIQHLPVFTSIRAVARTGIMIGLSGSVLLFYLLRTHAQRNSVAIVAICIVLFDFLFFPVSTQSTLLPSIYQTIKNQPGTTIIEIPAATNYVSASRSLYASRIHGKEVLGNIALERAQSQEEFSAVKSAPALRQVLYLRTTELRRGRTEFFNQALPESFIDTLNYFNVGAIVIDTNSVSALQLSALRNFLEEDVGLESTIDSDTVSYLITPTNLPLPSDGIFIMRDGRFEGVGFDPKRNSVFGEVPSEATLSIVNTTSSVKTVELSFIIPAESPAGLLVSTSTTMAPLVLPGQQFSHRFSITPGITEVSFTTQGAGKAIIQNPAYRVALEP